MEDQPPPYSRTNPHLIDPFTPVSDRVRDGVSRSSGTAQLSDRNESPRLSALEKLEIALDVWESANWRLTYGPSPPVVLDSMPDEEARCLIFLPYYRKLADCAAEVAAARSHLADTEAAGRRAAHLPSRANQPPSYEESTGVRNFEDERYFQAVRKAYLREKWLKVQWQEWLEYRRGTRWDWKGTCSRCAVVWGDNEAEVRRNTGPKLLRPSRNRRMVSLAPHDQV